MSFKKSIRLLNWFNLFASLNFYAPIAIIYFAKVTGSYALGASIFSIAMISSAVFEIPTGIFSDMIGRKKTLVLGAFCSVIFIALYAIRLNYWFLEAGAILDGLARALYSGNNDALLHNTLTAEGLADDYHIYYSRLNTFLTGGLFISALFSSFIASWSFSLVMWLSVASQIIALGISFFIPNTKAIKGTSNIYAHLKDAFNQIRKSYNLRLLSISHILGNGIGQTASTFQPAVYSLIWPLWAVGIARAIGELCAVFSFHFSEKIINKLGKARTILTCTVYAWLANLLPAVFPTVLTPIIIPSSALLYGSAVTAAESMKQAEFSEEQRATIASLNSLGASLFFAIFAYCIGLFTDQIGPIRSLIIIQIFFIPVIFLDWKLVKSMVAENKIGN
jgi:MFS family permease